MAQITGIELPGTLNHSLGGSPEDAAKAFLKAATSGLGRVMREAVIAALDESLGGTGDGATLGNNPPAWTQLITGCIVDLAWDTPPGTMMQRINSISSPDDQALGGIGFSIGITGTF